MPPKTYLRVRRRRNAGTALTLRLDGLEEAWNSQTSVAAAAAAADKGVANNTTTEQQRPTSLKRSAVWRRVSSDNPSEACRVVEAILSESDNEDHRASDDAAPCKRRRLTLVQGPPRTSAPDNNNNKKAKQKGKIKILHPVERLIDESLQAVAVGTISPRQHYNFIWTDTRVSHQARQWLAWRNEEIGNLLHAAAIWNDAELTADLLRMDLPHLVDAVDGDGRTPYEVAELMGNENVQEIMEAFGADTKNFVYDLYCLEGHVEGEVSDENQMACLLKGAMGYWNEDGELMLEQESDAQRNNMDEAQDDDIDSNDEAWEGNDYPDENEGYFCDNNSDEGDMVYPGEVIGQRTEDDGEYDYAYGL